MITMTCGAWRGVERGVGVQPTAVSAWWTVTGHPRCWESSPPCLPWLPGWKVRLPTSHRSFRPTRPFLRSPLPPPSRDPFLTAGLRWAVSARPSRVGGDSWVSRSRWHPAWALCFIFSSVFCILSMQVRDVDLLRWSWLATSNLLFLFEAASRFGKPYTNLRSNPGSQGKQHLL